MKLPDSIHQWPGPHLRLRSLPTRVEFRRPCFRPPARNFTACESRETCAGDRTHGLAPGPGGDGSPVDDHEEHNRFASSNVDDGMGNVGAVTRGVAGVEGFVVAGGLDADLAFLHGEEFPRA